MKNAICFLFLLVSVATADASEKKSPPIVRWQDRCGTAVFCDYLDAEVLPTLRYANRHCFNGRVVVVVGAAETNRWGFVEVDNKGKPTQCETKKK